MFIEEFNEIEFLSERYVTGSTHTNLIGEVEQQLTIKTFFTIEKETFVVYSYQNAGVKDKTILIGTRKGKYMKYNVIDLPGFYQILNPNAPINISYISGSGSPFIPDISEST